LLIDIVFVEEFDNGSEGHGYSFLKQPRLHGARHGEYAFPP
jgi:hypothetical protein